MSALWALQVIEHYPTLSDAQAGLEFMRSQTDFLGGRVCEPDDAHPRWWIQTFHTAPENRDPGYAWPDGVRLVIVPELIQKRCQFKDVR